MYEVASGGAEWPAENNSRCHFSGKQYGSGLQPGALLSHPLRPVLTATLWET